MITNDEFENEIIDIRRVSKVTKGGRNLKFR
ncbi:30S ribosomal protein S5, partial [Candidatus Acetothermia bacterium]